MQADWGMHGKRNTVEGEYTEYGNLRNPFLEGWKSVRGSLLTFVLKLYPGQTFLRQLSNAPTSGVLVPNMRVSDYSSNTLVA